MNMQELEKVLGQKQSACCGVEERMRVRRGELEDEVRVKLNDELGAELEMARVEWAKAKAEWEAERDRIRMEESLSNLPYPEGTILRKWRWDMYARIWRETGDYVVLQIFRKGDKIPGNCRWGIPHVGQVVIRDLKKDRTPALAVEVWQDYMKPCVLPEGVQPKVENKA